MALAEELHLHWHFEPSVVAGIWLAALLYLAVVGPLRRLFGGSAPVSPARQLTFLAGLAVFAYSLVSPLDHLAEEYLFSAHMLQHLLMTLAAAPLLVLGLPGWLLRPALRWPRSLALARFVTRPAAAFVIANGVFWLWHWPDLYDLALEQTEFHILEHLMYLGSAMLMWWPVCSPLPELPRLSYPLQAFYLFVNSLACNALGALITLQGALAYGFYEHAPRVLGLSPLDDQKLGGLLMWVGGSTFYLIVIGVVFLRWALSEERRQEGELAGDAAPGEAVARPVGPV